jgi:hypothetical protein
MHITANIHHDAKTKQAIYKSLASHLGSLGWEVRLTPEENGFRLLARSPNNLPALDGVWYPRDLLEATRILDAVIWTQKWSVDTPAKG